MMPYVALAPCFLPLLFAASHGGRASLQTVQLLLIQILPLKVKSGSCALQGPMGFHSSSLLTRTTYFGWPVLAFMRRL